MTKLIRLVLVAASTGVLSLASSAQIQHGGVPRSQVVALGGAVHSVTLPDFDVEELLAEDEMRTSGEAFRWALVHEVQLGLANAGTWSTLPGGDRVWRLRVESRGAYALMVSFSRFQLPAGAELFVYDDARAQIRGAYTELNNRLDGQFAIQPTAGDALTLEYFEPSEVCGQGELELSAVLHDYAGIVGKGGEEGTSGACNVDVACGEADSVRAQVRSVVTILTATGTCCTGVMLNNTSQDETPYVLSAQHCGGLNNALFQFNWKRPGCGSGSPLAQNDTVFGSSLAVGNGVLDFQLVELATQPPPGFDVYYAGWDNSDVQPTSAKCLHHPSGDVMKVSVESNLPRYSNSYWKIRIWDVGVTEAGSSGAPLFDQDQRVIGQLKGGSAACGNPIDDFFGRMAPQWTQLGPFLDPQGTGAATMDGLDTAGGGGFAVAGVFPASVRPLLPGTSKSVQLTGSGFTPGSTVSLDGVPLPVASYAVVAGHRIDIDLPLTPIGAHTLEVTESGMTGQATLTVVQSPTPIHQAGDGDALGTVHVSTGVALANADVVGHTNVTLWSFSNAPSVHPLVNLGIGANFTDLMRCNLVTIPSAGYNEMVVSIPMVLVDQTIYSQSYCPRCPSPPSGFKIQVSNVQSVVVKP